MLHPSLYYPPGHWSLWNVSDFSPRVGNTLETRFYLHNLPVPFFPFSLPIQQNSTRGLLNFSLPNWLFFLFSLELTMEEHVRARFEFQHCFPAVECFLCVKAQSKGETFNLLWPFAATQAWVWLTASTRAQEIQIRNLFYPQWHNHSTYSSSPESHSYALKGCSIGYLWVTGLRNSV